MARPPGKHPAVIATHPIASHIVSQCNGLPVRVTDGLSHLYVCVLVVCVYVRNVDGHFCCESAL